MIGSSTIPGTYILPQLIGSFKSLHPSIQIRVRISSSAEVVDRILDGGIEFGLIGARWDDRRILLEEVFSDELVLIVYPEHRWAKAPSVEIEQIADEPFIFREKGSGTRIVMTRALEAAGLPMSRMRVIAEMGSTEAVRQAVKARIGVAIVSSQAVAEDLERRTLVALPLKEMQISRPFYLAQRKNRQPSPLCTAFLNHLRAEAAEKNARK